VSHQSRRARYALFFMLGVAVGAILILILVGALADR
jgi:hypothetical protein